MGLFDLFSNDTAETAAAQRNAGLQQGYDALSSSYGQGRDALSSSLGQGRNALTGNIDQGNNAIISGYGQGRDAINSNFSNASNLWGGLLGSSNAGATAYGNASGANGVTGLQQATSDFKNSGQYGAYGFSLDQGLQALNRTHAAAGNLSSGNADADSMKYATGLAGQQYNNYLTGLQPYLGQQANATAGAAGVATGQGNALNQNYTGQGGALSSNYGALGAGLNSSYGNEGQGANASYMGQGGAANANYTGQGASNAAATMNNYNVGQNQLNAITGVAKLAAGMF
jgi:hypothetical protein